MTMSRNGRLSPGTKEVSSPRFAAFYNWMMDQPLVRRQFDSAVVTLVFCSVQDPERGLREIWRVLKPGGTLLLLEHVRAQGKMVAWVQDALVPLSTRCMGHCHWNRDTLRMVLHTGFQTTQVRQLSGGLQSMLLVHAMRPQTSEETDEGQ